jgi:hypothetical protein
MLLRLNNCINNFFWLVMIFRSAIAPWNVCRFSTLNSKPPSSEHVLTSSPELLALHVTLLEQHLQLQARLTASASGVTHYRNKFLECRTNLDSQLTSSKLTSSKLQETSAKYDKLSAQIALRKIPFKLLALSLLTDSVDSATTSLTVASIHSATNCLFSVPILGPRLAASLCHRGEIFMVSSAQPFPDRSTSNHLRPVRVWGGGGYYVKIQDPLQSLVG